MNGLNEESRSFRRPRFSSITIDTSENSNKRRSAGSFASFRSRSYSSFGLSIPNLLQGNASGHVYARRVESKKLKGARWTIYILLSFFFTTWACWIVTVFHCSLICGNDGQGLGLFLITATPTATDDNGGYTVQKCTWYSSEEIDTYFGINQQVGRIFGASGLGFHTIAFVILLAVMLVTNSDAIPNARSKLLLQQREQAAIRGREIVDQIETESKDPKQNKDKDEDEVDEPKIVTNLHRLWRLKQLLLFLSFVSLVGTCCFASLDFCTGFGEVDDDKEMENEGIPTFLGMNSCKPGAAGILALINGFLLLDLILFSMCIDFKLLFENKINRDNESCGNSFFEESSNNSENNKNNQNVNNNDRESNPSIDRIGISDNEKNTKGRRPVFRRKRTSLRKQESLVSLESVYDDEESEVMEPMDTLYESDEEEEKVGEENNNEDKTASGTPLFNEKQAELQDLIERLNKATEAVDELQDMVNINNASTHSTSNYRMVTNKKDDATRRLSDTSLSSSNKSDMSDLSPSREEFEDENKNSKKKRDKKKKKKKNQLFWKNPNTMAQSLDAIDENNEVGDFGDVDKDIANRISTWLDGDETSGGKTDKKENKNKDKSSKNNRNKFHSNYDNTSGTTRTTISISDSSDSSSSSSASSGKPLAAVSSPPPPPAKPIPPQQPPPSRRVSSSPQPSPRRRKQREQSPGKDTSPPASPKPFNSGRPRRGRRGGSASESPFDLPFDSPRETPPRGRRRPKQQEASREPSPPPSLSSSQRSSKKKRAKAPPKHPSIAKTQLQQQSSSSSLLPPRRPARSSSPPPARATRQSSLPPTEGELGEASSSKSHKRRRRRTRKGGDMDAYNYMQHGLQPVDLIDSSKLGKEYVMPSSDSSDDSSMNLSGIIRTSVRK